MKFLIRDHPLDKWEEIEGNDVIDALSDWAERMDSCNDYFISQATQGYDIEVRESDSEIINVYTIHPEFHTSYWVSKKND